MKRKEISILKVIIILTILLISFLVKHGYCYENIKAIDLSRQIKKEVKKLEEIKKEYSEKESNWNKKEQEVVREIKRTNNKDEKDKLAKKYFYFRAMELKERAEKVKQGYEVVNSILDKTEKLERLLKKNNLKDSIPPERKKEISHTMKSIANFIKIAKISTNNPALKRKMAILKSIDRRLKMKFSTIQRGNIKTQKEYMIDAAAYLKTLMDLLEEERIELLNNINILTVHDVILRIDNSNIFNFESGEDEINEKINNDLDIMEELGIDNNLLPVNSPNREIGDY